MTRSATPVALVTGGSRGLGACIARRLAAGGFRVALTYLSARDRADRVVAGIRELGGVASAYHADGRDTASVEAAVRAVLEDFGRIDVLVNNAGKTADGIAVALREEFDDVVQTNLRSVFTFSRAVIRHMMRARSGRIINMSSMVGRNPGVGNCNYVAAKAAIDGFTRSLAAEVAGRGVTVNAVAPGLVMTDLSRDFLVRNPAVVGGIPAGRLGEPEEVAALVEYLAGDDAAYITGEVIGMTGGACL